MLGRLISGLLLLVLIFSLTPLNVGAADGHRKVSFNLLINKRDAQAVQARFAFKITKTPEFSRIHYALIPGVELFGTGLETEWLPAVFDHATDSWFLDYEVKRDDRKIRCTRRSRPLADGVAIGLLLEGDLLGKHRPAADWWASGMQDQIVVTPRQRLMRQPGRRGYDRLSAEVTLSPESIGISVTGQPVEFQVENRNQQTLKNNPYGSARSLSGYAWVIRMNTLGQTPVVPVPITPTPPVVNSTPTVTMTSARPVIFQLFDSNDPGYSWRVGTMRIEWDGSQPTTAELNRSTAGIWKSINAVTGLTHPIKKFTVELRSDQGLARLYHVMGAGTGSPVATWPAGSGEVRFNLQSVETGRRWTISLYQQFGGLDVRGLKLNVSWQSNGVKQHQPLITDANGRASFAGPMLNAGDTVSIEVPEVNFTSNRSYSQLQQGNFDVSLRIPDNVKRTMAASPRPQTPVPAADQKVTFTVMSRAGERLAGAKLVVDGVTLPGQTAPDGTIAVSPLSTDSGTWQVSAKHADHVFKPAWVGKREPSPSVKADRSVLQDVKVRLVDERANPVSQSVRLNRANGGVTDASVNGVIFLGKVRLERDQGITLADLGLGAVPPTGFNHVLNPVETKIGHGGFEFDIPLTRKEMGWQINVRWRDAAGRQYPVPNGSLQLGGELTSRPIRGGSIELMSKDQPVVVSALAAGFGALDQRDISVQGQQVQVLLRPIEQNVVVQAVDEMSRQPVSNLQAELDGRPLTATGNTVRFSYLLPQPFRSLKLSTPRHGTLNLGYSDYERARNQSVWTVNLKPVWKTVTLAFRVLDSISDRPVAVQASHFTFYEDGGSLDRQRVHSLSSQDGVWQLNCDVKRDRPGRISVQVEAPGYLASERVNLSAGTPQRIRLTNSKRSMVILLNDASGWSDAQRIRADVRDFLLDTGQTLVKNGASLAFGSTDKSKEPTYIRGDEGWNEVRQRLDPANALVAARMRPENLVEIFDAFGRGVSALQAGRNEVVVIAPRQNSPPPGIRTDWVGELRRKLETERITLHFIEVDSISRSPNRLLKELCEDNYHKIRPAEVRSTLEAVTKK